MYTYLSCLFIVFIMLCIVVRIRHTDNHAQFLSFVNIVKFWNLSSEQQLINYCLIYYTWNRIESQDEVKA